MNPLLAGITYLIEIHRGIIAVRDGKLVMLDGGALAAARAYIAATKGGRPS